MVSPSLQHHLSPSGCFYFLPPPPVSSLLSLCFSSLYPPHLLPISSWHLLSTSLIILFFKCLIKNLSFPFLLSISLSAFASHFFADPQQHTQWFNNPFLFLPHALKGLCKVLAAFAAKDYLTFYYSLRAVCPATVEKHAHMHVNAPAHWYRHRADLHKVNTVVCWAACQTCYVVNVCLIVFLLRI